MLSKVFAFAQLMYSVALDVFGRDEGFSRFRASRTSGIPLSVIFSQSAGKFCKPFAILQTLWRLSLRDVTMTSFLPYDHSMFFRSSGRTLGPAFRETLHDVTYHMTSYDGESFFFWDQCKHQIVSLFFCRDILENVYLGPYFSYS